MTQHELGAVIQQEAGWFIATCPAVPGANGQGRTRSECLDGLVEAIALILEDRRESGALVARKRVIRPADTSPEAQHARIEDFRRMTPTQKLQRVGLLNEALKILQKERIRARYGDISDEEMRMRLGALRLGRETMIKVFGWYPDEKGW
jgi:predicted RNase H-like HicB family nuclease